MRVPILVLAVAAHVAASAHPLRAESDAAPSPSRFFVSVEGDLTWQSRNDARIPGDDGTKFSLADFGADGGCPGCSAMDDVPDSPPYRHWLTH